MQMRHTCLWTSEQHENVQKRGSSDKKVQKVWILLGGARAKKQIHRSCSGPPIFPKQVRTGAEKRKDIMFVILYLPERKNESKQKVKPNSTKCVSTQSK